MGRGRRSGTGVVDEDDDGGEEEEEEDGDDMSAIVEGVRG